MTFPTNFLSNKKVWTKFMEKLELINFEQHATDVTSDFARQNGYFEYITERYVNFLAHLMSGLNPNITTFHNSLSAPR